MHVEKKHASQLDEIFSKLVKNRHQRAINAGFKNFRDYQHASYNRFDYTPDDCFIFHDTVEHLVVPLLKKLRDERAEKLSLPVLRPWDLAVDADGEQPLRPFTKASELIDACQNIFASLDKDLAAQFKTMNDLDLLDLENRKGKAPGGYQSTLDEVRLPFIFMNASGTNQDLFTLLHEAGHAFHAFASRGEPWVAYRHAPMEFCEVASMSMELMGMDYLGKAYNDPQEEKRAKRDILEDILVKLPWIAAIDAFQHWIYLNPEHTAEERALQFSQLMKRFNPGIDWSAHEESLGRQWQKQLHLFEVPFYYIEYGIAQLGALQLWLKYKKNPLNALAAYKKGLSLGGARPLHELFEAAEIHFDFTEKTIVPALACLREELSL